MNGRIPAFIAASHRDYYGIETDTHITVDGKYVIIHDNCTGHVSPVHILMENSTYNDLRSVLLYDDGSTHSFLGGADQNLCLLW